MLSDSSVKIIQSLSKKQLRQLIHYSNTDHLIIKNTEDSRRFKDEQSFFNWLNNGKYLYALVDSKNNLQGLVWFSRKPPPKNSNLDSSFKYTFAIRIYPGFRGKGWSEKLMNEAFLKFVNSSEYIRDKGNFWLTTGENNRAAINLYNKFGFSEKSKTDGYIIMKFDGSNFQNRLG